MREVEYLGIKKTGHIDKRYGTESTASYSIFECPVCLKQQELRTSKGKKQNTCNGCKSTQNISHGMSNTRPYRIWQGIFQRCENPNNVKYDLYGGRGIRVSNNWRTFEGFWEDMKDTYQDDLTIDRIDSEGWYTKKNCRWLTHSENSSNTVRKRKVVQLRKILKPIKGFEFMKEWESTKSAADDLGLVAAHITAVCQGKRKTHGGFGWAYADEYKIL